MKLPKKLHLDFDAETKIFKVEHESAPGAVITIDADKLEKGFIWLISPNGPVKRASTHYSLTLAYGILIYKCYEQK